MIFRILLFCLFPISVFSQTLTSSNLPIVSINTEGKTIADEPRIQAKMQIRYVGAGQTTNITDAPNVYDGLIDIEHRGSTSQSFPQKPYALDTINADGSDRDISPFGFPNEHNWILFPPYNDKTLMRDVLAYNLARGTGRYASRTQYVELILNGEYRGLYVFMEKINRDNNRVNISKMTTTDISGDALTGGYIVKVDKTTGSSASGWTSTYPPKVGQPQRIYYQIEYPKLADITSQQKSYLQNWMTDFEFMMSGSSYNHATNGYSKWIDVASFVDYALVNEISKNVDGYRLSTYLSKDRDSKGGKLKAGPVWDFNLGFGNANYHDGQPTSGWQIEFNSKFQDNFYQPFWWEKLWKESAFQNAAQCRWRALRNTTFNKQRIHRWIDSTAQVLASPKDRHFAKWRVMGVYVWPNAFIGKSYSEEVNYLKTWVENRINWMDNNLAGTCQNIVPPSDTAPDFFSAQFFPNPMQNSLNLTLHAPIDGLLKIKMYDLLGKEVFSERRLIETPRIENVSWQINLLPNGMYVVLVELGAFRKTLKIVVSQ